MTNFPTLLYTSTQEIKYLAFYDLLHARRLKKRRGGASLKAFIE